MEVRNRFSSIFSVIDDEAIPSLLKADQRGYLGGFEQQVSEHGLILAGGFRDARQRLAGDDEDVDGGLWLDVAEGHHEIVFVDDAGRDFAVTDLLEDGLAHGGTWCAEIGLGW